MTDMPTSDPTQREILHMADTWAHTVTPEQERFIRDLVELERDLRPIVIEHVDYYQEMLPTQVMGDIARWTETVAAGADDPARRLKPMMDKFEQAWGDGDGPVAELIAVSFVENVFDNPTLVHLMGPKLSGYQRLCTGQGKADTGKKHRPMPEIHQATTPKTGNAVTDPTAWQTQVRQEMADAFRLARRAAQSVSDVQGRASSRHGELSITVDALGRVRDIHFPGRISGLTGQALAQLILTNEDPLGRRRDSR